MVERIANHVLEGSHHAFEHGSVNTDISAANSQLRAFAQLATRLAGDVP